MRRHRAGSVLVGMASAVLLVLGIHPASGGSRLGYTPRTGAEVRGGSKMPGTKLWLKRYNGPGDAADAAVALGVSPGGDTVFVTGLSWGSNTNFDYATVAYDTTTGAKLWVARYDGPIHGYDRASGLVVDPYNGPVIVTGFSMGSGTDEGYATIAYDPSRWRHRRTERSCSALVVTAHAGHRSLLDRRAR